jgi:hypothetical protein
VRYGRAGRASGMNSDWPNCSRLKAAIAC